MSDLEFSATGLRSVATEMRTMAEKADPWPCPSWTYEAVRHIARNCEIDCNHTEWNDETEAWREWPCPSPDGTWDRYESSAHIHAWSPKVATSVADLLDTLADWLDEGYDDNWPPFAAAWNVAQAWLGGQS